MSDVYSGQVKEGKLMLDSGDEIEVFRRPSAPMVAEAPEKLDLSGFEGRRIKVAGNLYNGQLWGASIVRAD